jgi:MinD-like ATPase involved in chromosome partitioning or flagellar assembly
VIATSSRMPVPERLYTWIDVDEHMALLATEGWWPEWLLEAGAYWDSLELRVRPNTDRQAVLGWLEQAFGVTSVLSEPPQVLLEDIASDVPHRARRALDVTIVPVDLGDLIQVRRLPQLRERRIVADLKEPLPPPHPDTFASNVQITAFHSFKGGVGRTLQAIALALAMSRRGIRVLLVDADLEAPGITRMVEAQGRRLDFAYEDFLALLHGSIDGTASDAVWMGQLHLPNQALHSNLLVLPASRRMLTSLPPRIEPGDLLTPDRSQYFLTESLAELAAAVGAQAAIVDLRAGSSELAAPLLLDARVQRVFVTTLSDQAMQGTNKTVRELGRRAPTTRETDPPAAAIITQFRAKDHDSQVIGAAAELRESLRSTMRLPTGPEGDSEVVDADLATQPLLSEFTDALLALPARWDDVVGLIDRAELPTTMEPLADSLRSPTASEPEEQSVDGQSDLNAGRRRLAETARELVYGETARVREFLVTQSLRNLLISHRTEPPIVVAVGAKGSGKTFTYLQMCARRDWRQFAIDAGVDGVLLEGAIVPVLASQNVDLEVMQELTGAVAKRFGGPPLDPIAVRDRIHDRLAAGGAAPSEWRRIWLSIFARAIGLDVEPSEVERRLAEAAARGGLIFLVDGLEDLFQDVARDEAQRQALRVLLTDCLDWMRTVRGRPIGLVVFVRRDLVYAAIAQNVGQFLARYEPYELRWNADEALRLALWVSRRSGVLPGPDLASIGKASGVDLVRALVPLWGERMGGPRSREARSDQWFLAALSDFKLQIQARDIVSFLAEAAGISAVDAARLPDRLLQPAAMRRALVACSEDKIRAVSEENVRLGEILQRLQRMPAEQRQIPFRADALGLEADELDLLDANGVVFREEDQYWIPEIFRHGLGFTTKSRPRIMATANVLRRRTNPGGT